MTAPGVDLELVKEGLARRVEGAMAATRSVGVPALRAFRMTIAAATEAARKSGVQQDQISGALHEAALDIDPKAGLS
jgi:hypothetical protein